MGAGGADLQPKSRSGRRRSEMDGRFIGLWSLVWKIYVYADAGLLILHSHNKRFPTTEWPDKYGENSGFGLGDDSLVAGVRGDNSM